MIQNGVVMTGSGMICSAGSTLDRCLNNFVNGIPSLHEIPDQKLLDGYGSHYAGLIKELPQVNISSRLTQTIDRHVVLAAAAAGEALQASGIDYTSAPDRVGIIIGTCSGPMLTIESGYRQEIGGEYPENSQFCFAKQYYSAALVLAEQFGINGPAFTVTTACSAFTVAAGIASDLIRCGMLDVVLVGGSDAHSMTTQAGFNGLKATGKGTKCAPFSRPVGLNLGEGSAFVVLESKEYAVRRNAQILGEILGYGLSNDAYHCSAPDPAGKGAAAAIQNALSNAGVDPENIRYINAHGTGTEANDKAETKAIVRVFGDLSGSIPISSLKSITGHCLGAAGAVELVASLACMKNGRLPPTVNFSEPRDGCTLDYIPESGRTWNNGSVFLKNNFAFGGNNASLVVSDTQVARKCTSVVSRSDDPVCITSAGILSRFGVGFDVFCEGIRNPDSSIETSWHNNSKVFKVPEFRMSQIDRRVTTKGIDTESEMNIAAATLALSQAGIPDRHPLRQKLGFVMNIAHGSTWAEPQHIKPLLKNDFKLEQINAFPYIVPNSITGTICRVLTLTGYNTTFCNGPGAGLTGLGLSSVALHCGHAPAVLCGSSDLFSDGSRDCCIADNIDYRTTQFGDGAVMVLLERLSSAAERGTKPLCSIESVCFSNTVGNVKNTGSSCAFDTVLLESMIDDALRAAGINGDNISRICGTFPDEFKEILSNKTGVERLVDVSSLTGLALSSQPLFNLFAALGTDHFEPNGDKNYILAVSNAFHGNVCIMVIKPYF